MVDRGHHCLSALGHRCDGLDISNRNKLTFLYHVYQQILDATVFLLLPYKIKKYIATALSAKIQQQGYGDCGTLVLDNVKKRVGPSSISIYSMVLLAAILHQLAALNCQSQLK